MEGDINRRTTTKNATVAIITSRRKDIPCHKNANRVHWFYSKHFKNIL